MNRGRSATTNCLWGAYSMRAGAMPSAGVFRSRGRRDAGEFFGGGAAQLGAVARADAIHAFLPFSGRSNGDDAPVVDAPGMRGRRNASVSGCLRQTANLTTRPRRARGTPPGLAATAAIGRGGFPLSRCARVFHAPGVRRGQELEIFPARGLSSWQYSNGCGAIANFTSAYGVGGAGRDARLCVVAWPYAGDDEAGRGVGWHQGSDEVGTTVVWGRGIRVN